MADELRAEWYPQFLESVETYGPTLETIVKLVDEKDISKIVIDDMVYCLGIAISEEYKFSEGYRKFKLRLAKQWGFVREDQ